MKRWDRLVDKFMEEYEAAGKATETVKATRRELDRWGNWLKNLRPRPALDEVNSDLIIRYLRGRAAYRAKATLSGTMSKLRCLGEFLVRESIWLNNPLRWLRGPKLDIRSRLPRRISPEVMRGLWEAAAKSRYGYHRSVWVTLLSIFYGTGMRRGDVCQLNVSDWCRDEGLLLVRNSKTGQTRRVPVPALTWQCLEAYLPKRQNHVESRGTADEPALFVSRSGGRLKATAISRAIQSLGRSCSRNESQCTSFAIRAPRIFWKRERVCPTYNNSWATSASVRRCVTCTWPTRSCIKRSRSIPSTRFLRQEA